MTDLKDKFLATFWMADEELVFHLVPVLNCEHDEQFYDTQFPHYMLWASYWLYRNNQNPNKYLNPNYDFYPRGRIVYNSKKDCFTIYASRQILENNSALQTICRVCHYTSEDTVYPLDDGQYRTPYKTPIPVGKFKVVKIRCKNPEKFTHRALSQEACRDISYLYDLPMDK